MFGKKKKSTEKSDSDVNESGKSSNEKKNELPAALDEILAENDEESGKLSPTETEGNSIDDPISKKAVLPLLPSSYEIEYRTRVRFPAPEILAAAAEIGEKVDALEADLAGIKQLVSLIQEKIARGFDVTESSSSIFGSSEAAAGFESLGTKTQEEAAKEKEPEEIDDSFMTLL